MKYKKNVIAIYENSFCMDSNCIHYFEDMCMPCMSDEGCTIFPDSTVRLKARDSSLCKSFSRGSFIGYVLTNEELNMKDDEGLEFEMLEYGDRVELENGDICVYVRRELEGGSIISQELVLINVFTGEERCINEYKDNLEHDRNPSLDIKRFAN